MEWTKEEVLDHINTNGFFASCKLNRISVGPSIYTNPPLPGEIGLLPYTTSHSQPAQQPAHQQYTLQQNGSTERSSGVVMPREELDKTSKEEPNETRTDIGGSRQVDSGGNRQVDSSGNQDQANDQENAIGPQAPSAKAPSVQAPSAQALPAQAPPAQAPPTQALSAQALSTQAPSTQAPSTQAPPG